jgi:hypothetical protein
MLCITKCCKYILNMWMWYIIDNYKYFSYLITPWCFLGSIAHDWIFFLFHIITYLLRKVHALHQLLSIVSCIVKIMIKHEFLYIIYQLSPAHAEKGAPRQRKMKFWCKKKCSSNSRSADTLARITDDGYKGGGEEHCTRHPKMDVNLLTTY